MCTGTDKLQFNPCHLGEVASILYFLKLNSKEIWLFLQKYYFSLSFQSRNKQKDKPQCMWVNTFLLFFGGWVGIIFFYQFLSLVINENILQISSQKEYTGCI